MNNESVFRNRAYVVNDTKLRAGFEGEVLRRVLSMLDKPVRLDEASLMDGTPDYDSYRVEGGGKYYNVKLSFDTESPPLLYERDVLQGIPQTVGPRFIKWGKMEVADTHLLFLLSSWDFAETIANIGRGVLLDAEGLRAAPTLLNNMRLCKTDSVQDFSEFISKVFKRCDVRSYFFDDSVEALDDHSDLDKIEGILQQIKTEITGSYDPELMSREPFVCHGNMGMENVLFRQGQCKLRNFENAFIGSQWLDVAHLVLDMGLTGESERELIKHLEAGIGSDFHVYKEIKDFYSKLYLLRLAVEYLMEVYIFSSSRPSKIIYLNSKFVQNYSVFNRIETFREHRDFISKLITEPILGFKA